MKKHTVRRALIRLSVCLLSILPLLCGTGCGTVAYKKNKFGASAGAALNMPITAADCSEEDIGTKSAETGNIEQTTNATDRLIMYEATLRVVVSDAESALNAILTMAANLGGYMQFLSDNAITLRIPALRLSESIREVERMGDVSSRRITGMDVTEEMLDLDIRLKNMQEMRDRLVALLDRAANVEELLAVEQELQRVTAELELIKGRIKYLSHAVSYCTLTVHVNSSVPQEELLEVIPFAWVRSLAADIIPRPGASYTPERRSRHWLKMDMPPNCVTLSEIKGCTRIVSGNGVMLLIRRHDNFAGGSLEFWNPIIRRFLLTGRAMALEETTVFDLDSGARGLKLNGAKMFGKKSYEYTLWIVVVDEYVYSFECWGPADEIALMRPQLEKTARSMGIKP